MRRYVDREFAYKMARAAKKEMETPISDGWLDVFMNRANPEHRMIFFIPPRGKKHRAGFLFDRDGDRLLVGQDQASATWADRKTIRAR
jgi:hypothetical protein